MRVIAIDWSGARRGAEKDIWLAEVADGHFARLEAGRGRDEVGRHLIAEAGRDPALVVGFDFAFSLPAWFLDERDLTSAPGLWELVEREGEEWLRSYPPPFWGRKGTRRLASVELFRHTDRAVPSMGGVQPKSVFQISGPGTVGTGSLRGMPILRRLRGEGFAIWPFDAPVRPLVVEIYPRLLTREVNKSSAIDRGMYLAARYPSLDARLRQIAEANESAFDAAVSALVMARHLDDLTALPAVTDRQILLEGLIWYPGWRTADAPARGL